ncbi:MAG: hypothetical protein GY765_00720 [bacterium]|nr:hypothetical protein [bacterium]
MLSKIMGFLSIKGWDGVQQVFFFIVIASTVGMSGVYYFLVYQKMDSPQKRITVRGHLIKIGILLVALYFIIRLA